MNNQLSKLVWLKRTDNSYIESQGHDPNGALILLSLYFDECVRFDSTRFQFIKEYIEQEGRAGCNDINAIMIDGMLDFEHALIEGLPSLRISPDNLIELVKKWYELISARVDRIVITYDNGNFTISSE